MTVCSNCGAENPSEKKFCGDCGSALALWDNEPRTPVARTEEIMIADCTSARAHADREDVVRLSAALHPAERALLAAKSSMTAQQQPRQYDPCLSPMTHAPLTPGRHSIIRKCQTAREVDPRSASNFDPSIG